MQLAIHKILRQVLVIRIRVIIKISNFAGEMSIVQKNMLVNGFLCAIRDPDPLVRASGLSCLGELCKVLNYRLGNILTEVRI